MDSSLLNGLSSSCQGALPSLLTSSFATCADILGLVQVATASGSVVPALDSYIHDLCTASPCTQSDLDNANSIITNGCSTDIQQGALAPTALQLVIQNFSGIRAVACVERTSNSSYCLPEILYAAQNATGTQFNTSTLTSLASSSASGTNFLEGIPKDVYCSDCGSALTSELLQVAANVSQTAGSVDQARQQAQAQCGTNFGTGTLPAGITTVGANGTSVNSASTKSTKDSGALAGFSAKHALVYGTLVGVLASAVATIA